MTITWPDILKPNSFSVELRSHAVSGGRTATGREQRVIGDAGYWSLNYTVPVRTRAQVLEWRAMVDRLRAGEAIAARICDLQKPDGIKDAWSAVAASAAALRATQISITATHLQLEPGHHFTVGQRLYRINQVIAHNFGDALWANLNEGEAWSDGNVWLDDPYDGSNTYTVKFLPPLRAAVDGGDTLEFDALVCLAVPDEMTTGALDLDLGRFSDPTLALIESI